MNASVVIPELGLVLEGGLITPARVETKQSLQEITTGNISKLLVT